MGAAVAEMAVHHATVVVAGSHLVEVAKISTEFLRRDGSVFPAFPRRRLTGNIGNRAQRRFPDLPGFPCLLLVGEQPKTRRMYASGEYLHQAARLRFSFARGLRTEFRQKPPSALRKQCKS